MPSRMPSFRKIKSTTRVRFKTLRPAAVGGGDKRARRMRGIDHIHPLALLDLLAGHADLFEDLIGRFADGGFVHQIAAMPEAAAEREALFDDECPESHLRQVVGANQAGGAGADDDDVALDELVELFIVFPRNLPGNVSFA